MTEYTGFIVVDGWSKADNRRRERSRARLASTLRSRRGNTPIIFEQRRTANGRGLGK